MNLTAISIWKKTVLLVPSKSSVDHGCSGASSDEWWRIAALIWKCCCETANFWSVSTHSSFVLFLNLIKPIFVMMNKQSFGSWEILYAAISSSSGAECRSQAPNYSIRLKWHSFLSIFFALCSWPALPTAIEVRHASIMLNLSSDSVFGFHIIKAPFTFFNQPPMCTCREEHTKKQLDQV